MHIDESFIGWCIWILFSIPLCVVTVCVVAENVILTKTRFAPELAPELPSHCAPATLFMLAHSYIYSILFDPLFSPRLSRTKAHSFRRKLNTEATRAVPATPNLILVEVNLGSALYLYLQPNVRSNFLFLLFAQRKRKIAFSIAKLDNELVRLSLCLFLTILITEDIKFNEEQRKFITLYTAGWRKHLTDRTKPLAVPWRPPGKKEVEGGQDIKKPEKRSCV